MAAIGPQFIDLGRISSESISEGVIRQEFRFINRGNRTCRIEGMSSTCSCAEVAVNQSTIEPGALLVVTMSVEPSWKRRTGATARIVLAGGQGVLECGLRADVESPRETIEVDTVLAKDTRATSFSLRVAALGATCEDPPPPTVVDVEPAQVEFMGWIRALDATGQTTNVLSGELRIAESAVRGRSGIRLLISRGPGGHVWIPIQDGVPRMDAPLSD